MRLDLQACRTQVRAAWDLLLLEVRIVTGNRALVLVLVELAAFAGFWAWFHFGETRWTVGSLYNLCVVLPAVAPAFALGMVVVMGESEGRMLEVTFSGPGGRYLVWSFRLAAAAAFLAASAGLLSFATQVLVDSEHLALLAAAHAVVPLVFFLALTTLLSVAFKGQSAAGIGAVAVTVVSRLFLQGRGARYDPFMNPFNPPEVLDDPAVWFRAVVFNRTLLLALAGVFVAGTLLLLQRRERLL